MQASEKKLKSLTLDYINQDLLWFELPKIDHIEVMYDENGNYKFIVSEPAASSPEPEPEPESDSDADADADADDSDDDADADADTSDMELKIKSDIRDLITKRLCKDP